MSKKFGDGFNRIILILIIYKQGWTENYSLLTYFCFLKKLHTNIVQCHFCHMTKMSLIALETLVFLGCVTNLVWGVIYRLHLWFFSCTERINDSAQFLQGYDHNPVWILKCVFRWYDCLNDLLHSEHLNGLSSVWITICLFKVLGWLNDLVHSEQL